MEDQEQVGDAGPDGAEATAPARPGRWARWRPHVVHVGLVLLGVFLLLQLVPYGWEHPNPPVVADAPWPDAEAEAIARESCYSCHSNETDWPAYAYVAPMSWLVRSDVEAGRKRLNFSEWVVDDNEAEDAIEEIEDGAMPLSTYTLIHRGAELTEEERRILVDALDQMASEDEGGRGRGRGRGGDGDEAEEPDGGSSGSGRDDPHDD